MAADVPDKEPTEHQAGNSLLWTKSIGDYPASDWDLTYSIRGSLAGQFSEDITATKDGDDFEVTLTASQTASWQPGEYWLVGYVSDGTDRFEIYRGRFTITEDISTATSYDGRTYNQRCLDIVNRMIEDGLLPREVIRYSFNGVSSEVRTFEDAFKAKAYFEDKVANEQGNGRNRKILTRFRSPR